ncbi:MAG: ABC transporter transmembrane domain-containing protein, partial [Pseudomonadota bacterium]
MTDATLPEDAAQKPPPDAAGKPNEAPARKPRRVTADDGDTFQTLKALWPYLWPHDRFDLKVRVVLALIVLIIAKVINVGVPYLFKFATDALAGTPDLSGQDGFMLAVLGAPVLLVLAYGVARVSVMGFQQLRDGLFAKVSMNVVRKLGQETFDHLHKLSLRFHLARRTGGLSRIIERGTTGIETVVRFTILSIFPTMIEFVLAAIVIGLQFDWRYLLVLFGMMVGYV